MTISGKLVERLDGIKQYYQIEDYAELIRLMITLTSERISSNPSREGNTRKKTSENMLGLIISGLVREGELLEMDENEPMRYKVKDAKKTLSRDEVELLIHDTLLEIAHKASDRRAT